MKPDTWMPWFIGDYLADTMHLTTAQHGGYLLLIAAYWRNGGPLPASNAHLASIARATPAEWSRLAPVLARFFTNDGRVWRHKRIDEELTAASKRQARAQAAARARHEQAPSKSQAEPEQAPSTCLEAAPLPSPSPPLEAKASSGRAPPPDDPLEIPKALERRKATRLALDWKLPLAWQESALAARLKHNLSPIDLDLEADKFANHWWAKSGANATKVDWAATWVNWCLNDLARGNGNGQHRKPDQTARRRAGIAAAFADVAHEPPADGPERAGGEAGGDAGDLAPTGPVAGGGAVLSGGFG